MSIGRTFEESLLKAIRSLETGVFHLYMEKFDEKTREELLSYIKAGTDDRIFAVAQLLRLGCNVQQIAFETKIDGFFLEKMKKIIEMENMLKANPWNRDVLMRQKEEDFPIALWHGSGIQTKILSFALEKKCICSRFIK